jgi:RNA polymerase sigma factor (sigma-70 family)
MASGDRESDDGLLAVAASDPLAFAEFYRRYEPAVLSFFVRRVHDAEVAADLTAEVFAAALVACRRYQPRDGSATGWLFAIAGHKLADSVRRGRVEDRARRRVGMAPMALDDDDLARIERLGGDEVVSRLLDSLPAGQRDAILARVVDEREYSEIAGRLRCSESVVRKRVSRGLATLRQRMGEESA